MKKVVVLLLVLAMSFTCMADESVADYKYHFESATILISDKAQTAEILLARIIDKCECGGFKGRRKCSLCKDLFDIYLLMQGIDDEVDYITEHVLDALNEKKEVENKQP